MVQCNKKMGQEMPRAFPLLTESSKAKDNAAIQQLGADQRFCDTLIRSKQAVCAGKLAVFA
jgi:hypothetical protein